MRRLLALALLLAAFAAPPVARAAGGPVIGLIGSGGVLALDGSARYVTLGASRNITVVARVELPSGEIFRSRGIHGVWMVPAVAYDGTGGGLSADGTRLVLIKAQPSVPVRTTRLLVLGARRLRIQKTIALRGWYGFDAISPDGSTLYLTHYLSSRDPTRYEVMALDTSSGRLYPKPLVDPREPDEKMTGSPITRATSATGRWAYTLYDGGRSGKPFIHALDTERRRAFCIELEDLQSYTKRGGDLAAVRLRLEQGGRRLAVVGDDGETAALVDTKTLAVSAPARDARDVKAVASRDGESDGTSWLLPVLIPLGLVALAGALLVVRSRRRLAGGVRAR